MKRYAIFTIVFAALLPLSPASAKNGCEGCPEAPTITVTETVSHEHAPDTAVIDVAVETTSLIAAKAAEENARRSDALVKELKKLAGPGGSLRTSSYTVTPLYRDNKAIKVDGYRVTNRVTVTTRMLTNVGLIIDTAAKGGSNRISGLRFVLEDYSRYCSSVLEEASAKARSVADIVARSFGARIKGVKRIRPTCRPEAPSRAGVSLYKEAARTPVEAGTLKVHGTVDVEFFLED